MFDVGCFTYFTYALPHPGSLLTLAALLSSGLFTTEFPLPGSCLVNGVQSDTSRSLPVLCSLTRFEATPYNEARNESNLSLFRA